MSVVEQAPVDDGAPSRAIDDARVDDRRVEADDDVRDRGAVLVITLVLTLILAVVATSLATFATTGLKTSKVTDARNDQVTALDAGLRIGMELIQANPSGCLNVNYVVPQQISGQRLTVTCVQVTPALSTQWMTYRITSTLDGRSRPGVALVQAATSSGGQCLPLETGAVQSPPCELTINSWAVSG